jgi:hypothetical protein
MVHTVGYDMLRSGWSILNGFGKVALLPLLLAMSLFCMVMDVACTFVDLCTKECNHD